MSAVRSAKLESTSLIWSRISSSLSGWCCARISGCNVDVLQPNVGL